MQTITAPLYSIVFAYVAIEFFLLPTRQQSIKVIAKRCVASVFQHGALLFLIYLTSTGTPALLPTIGYLIWSAGKEIGDWSSITKWTIKHLIGLSLLTLCIVEENDLSKLFLEKFPAIVSPELIKIILAYTLVTRPASVVISLLMRPWTQAPGTTSGSSLPGGGTGIGYLERILVLTFILLDHWDAIGFLLATKGLLRFNDLAQGDHRATSEYVILGTLLSIVCAMSVGLAIHDPPKKTSPSESTPKTILTDKKPVEITPNLIPISESFAFS